MPLDAHIIDPATQEIDRDMTAFADPEQHGLLFQQVGRHLDRFPLLSRMSDYYGDALYVTAELDSLILEIEHTAALFEGKNPVSGFTGPFHSPCVAALVRNKNIVVYAD